MIIRPVGAGVPCGHIDRHNEANSRFFTILRTRLKFVYKDFGIYIKHCCWIYSMLKIATLNLISYFGTFWKRISVIASLISGRGGPHCCPPPAGFQTCTQYLFVCAVKMRCNGKWKHRVSHFGCCNTSNGQSQRIHACCTLGSQAYQDLYLRLGVIIWTSGLNSAVKTFRKYSFAESSFGVVMVNS